MCKKQLKKKNLEILRNIQLICYINKDKVNNYTTFLKNTMDKMTCINDKFKQYLYNFWFKKNPDYFNYSEFFEYAKKNNKTNALNKLYSANNTAESPHSKFNLYLPKTITTPKSFFYVMKKILINANIDKDNIIRYDIITRTILSIIEKEGLNETCKWITYDLYKNYFEKTLNENKINYEDSNQLIDIINKIN